MLTEIAHDSAAASEASRLRSEIKAALDAHARVHHLTAGEIWAYEIDAFGNAICMDDANVPSLLALPYLGSCSETDPMYLATRRFVLSEANPYFFRGSAAEGIGGPHIGQDMIWPMAIIMRGSPPTMRRSSCSASSGSRPHMPEPASCTRASTRTILRISRERGSPGPTLSSANSFSNSTRPIQSCLRKPERKKNRRIC